MSNSEIISLVSAFVIVIVCSVLFAILIAVFSKYFAVKNDERKDELMKMLPNVNCGACGQPGCSGFADAVLSKKITHIKQCKVVKLDKANEIVNYLNNTEGPDGSKLEVEI